MCDLQGKRLSNRVRHNDSVKSLTSIIIYFWTSFLLIHKLKNKPKTFIEKPALDQGVSWTLVERILRTITSEMLRPGTKGTS